MNEATSIDNQITALLTGNAITFVRERTGKDSVDSDDYSKVFALSRREIHEYVKKNGFPSGAFSSVPLSRDDIYMIENQGSYSVYYQERGIKFYKSTFKTKEEAESALIDQLLAHSGVEQYV